MITNSSYVDHVDMFTFSSIPDGKTPLSCAAGAGKDQTVSYLLSLEQTKIPKHSAVSWWGDSDFSVEFITE